MADSCVSGSINSGMSGGDAGSYDDDRFVISILITCWVVRLLLHGCLADVSILCAMRALKRLVLGLRMPRLRARALGYLALA